MAANALFGVRTMFVENVSEDMIDQLLDDLLQARVLNDGERDSISGRHMTRAEKARKLIDVVMKKGDNASRKMIDYLLGRDQELYSVLSQHSQSAQPAAQPKMETE